MKKNRRWEIALCDRGTVHLHYGTGSLHILKEDFVDLAVWNFNNWRIDWVSHYRNTKFKARKGSCSSHV
jgi:hypothetical protein